MLATLLVLIGGGGVLVLALGQWWGLRGRRAAAAAGRAGAPTRSAVLGSILFGVAMLLYGASRWVGGPAWFVLAVVVPLLYLGVGCQLWGWWRARAHGPPRRR